MKFHSFFSDSLYLIITIFLGCLLRTEHYGNKLEKMLNKYKKCPQIVNIQEGEVWNLESPGLIEEDLEE